MADPPLDPAQMERLAKALTFICGADHPTTQAVSKAADSKAKADIKRAYDQFLKLKSSDRMAALAMMRD